MFTPPRFVVIDDDEKHLDAIVATIQSLGSVCARVHYSAEVDVPAELFTAVRTIFIDLQLLNRAASSDFRPHYAEIQRILGNVIRADGGPYLLVVWTDKPEQVAELEAYLETPFFAEKPFARPIAIVPLSKTDYIDLGTGHQTAGNLLEDIRTHLGAQPAMNALVQWEMEVLGAAGKVLADVATLATELNGVGALPTLLQRLAVEAVGYANAVDDPREGVQAALLPLLQDHLQNAPVGSGDWDRAFEGAVEPAPGISKAQVGLLNSKLHITKQDAARPISPLAWGAVCELETDIDWSEFGLDDEAQYREQVVGKNLKLEWSKYEDKDKINIVQIRIGAACDYAQKTVGPIPYVLAALLPEREGVRPHDLNPKSTAWISPELDIDGNIVQFFVDPRYVRVRGGKAAASFAVIARIKEQLLLALVSAVGNHSSRPGIVRFVASAS